MDHETDLLPEEPISSVLSEESSLKGQVDLNTAGEQLVPENSPRPEPECHIPAELPFTATTVEITQKETTNPLYTENSEIPKVSHSTPNRTYDFPNGVNSNPNGPYSVPNTASTVPNSGYAVPTTPNNAPDEAYNPSLGSRNIPYASYGAPNDPRNAAGIPYGMPNAPYGTSNAPVIGPKTVANKVGSPYEPGYYQQNQYGNPYFYGNNGYWGSNYPPMSVGANKPPMPVVKESRKPVVALIFGILSMGIVNFFPFVGLILALVAICTAFSGLRQGRITPGKKACGIIGLVLGMIALILSITMLVILFSLSIRVMNQGGISADSIYR